MAIDSETEFTQELEVFGHEVEEAIRCFYAEQTIHNVAREDASVHRALHRNAAFWNLAARRSRSTPSSCSDGFSTGTEAAHGRIWPGNPCPNLLRLRFCFSRPIHPAVRRRTNTPLI